MKLKLSSLKGYAILALMVGTSVQIPSHAVSNLAYTLKAALAEVEQAEAAISQNPKVSNPLLYPDQDTLPQIQAARIQLLKESESKSPSAKLKEHSTDYLTLVNRLLFLRLRSFYSFTTIERIKKAPRVLDESNLRLELSQNAAMPLVASFPYQARFRPDQKQIHFFPTLGEIAFLESQVLSRSPESWSRLLNPDFKKALDPKSIETRSAPLTYDLDSKDSYARLIRFRSLFEAMTNRWAINRLFSDNLGGEILPQGCAMDTVTFHQPPGSRLSDAPYLKELMELDRFQSQVVSLPKLVSGILAALPPFSPAQFKRYGSAYFKSLENEPTFDLWKTEQLEEVISEYQDHSGKIIGEQFKKILGAPSTTQRLTAILIQGGKGTELANEIEKRLIEQFLKNAKVDFPQVQSATLRNKLLAYLKTDLEGQRRQIELAYQSLTSQNIPTNASAERLRLKTEELTQAILGSISLVEENKALKGIQFNPAVLHKTKKPFYATTAVKNPADLIRVFEMKLKLQPWSKLSHEISRHPKGKKMLTELFEKLVTLDGPLYDRVNRSVSASLAKHPFQVSHTLKPQVIRADQSRIVIGNGSNQIRTDFQTDELFTDDQLIRSIVGVLGWQVSLRSNDDLLRSHLDQLLLTEVLLADIYRIHPFLQTSWLGEKIEKRPASARKELKDYNVGDHYASKYGARPMKDGTHELMFSHYVDMTLLEHAARSKTRAEVQKNVTFALKRAYQSATGVVEKFCTAKPDQFEDDESFRYLFNSASSIRRGILATQFQDGVDTKLIKLDSDLGRATRTWSQIALDDYITPVAQVVSIISLLLLLGAAIFKAPLLIACGSFFGNAIAFPIFSAQLFFQTTVNFIELPPQLDFQRQVFQSQLYENGEVQDRATLLSDESKLATQQNITAISFGLQAVFWKQAVEFSKYLRHPIDTFKKTFSGVLANSATASTQLNSGPSSGIDDELLFDPLELRKSGTLSRFQKANASLLTLGDDAMVSRPITMQILPNARQEISQSLLQSADDINGIYIRVYQATNIQKSRAAGAARVLEILQNPNKLSSLVTSELDSLVTSKFGVATRLLPKSGVEALQSGRLSDWIATPECQKWIEQLSKKSLTWTASSLALRDLEQTLATKMGAKVTPQDIFAVLSDEDLISLQESVRLTVKSGPKGDQLLEPWMQTLKSKISPLQPNEISVVPSGKLYPIELAATSPSAPSHPSYVPIKKTFMGDVTWSAPAGIDFDPTVRARLIDAGFAQSSIDQAIAKTMAIQELRLEFGNQALSALKNRDGVSLLRIIQRGNASPVPLRVLPSAGLKSLRDGNFEAWLDSSDGSQWISLLGKKVTTLEYSVYSLNQLNRTLDLGVQAFGRDEFYALWMIRNIQRSLGDPSAREPWTQVIQEAVRYHDPNIVVF